MSDPAANTKLLSEQLSALGLYAAPTLGDGNCLFRALSDQIYGSPSKHLLLRDEICDWIEAHRQRYEPFVDDERGLDVHLQCMRQPGAYTFHSHPIETYCSKISHFFTHMKAHTVATLNSLRLPT